MVEVHPNFGVSRSCGAAACTLCARRGLVLLLALEGQARCSGASGKSRARPFLEPKGLQDLHSHAPGIIAAAGLISDSRCHVCLPSKGPPRHHRGARRRSLDLRYSLTDNDCYTSFVYFLGKTSTNNASTIIMITVAISAFAFRHPSTAFPRSELPGIQDWRQGQCGPLLRLSLGSG